MYPPAKAVEATIEVFLELTSDNLVVDQIFQEEGLCDRKIFALSGTGATSRQRCLKSM